MSDTREQALRALREQIAWAADHEDGNVDLMLRWMRDIDDILHLPADAAGLPWVAVEERLPEEEDENDQGLVLARSSMRAVAFTIDSCDVADGAPQITHWLPLSAIPLPADRERE